jgi:hypothetical protein
MENGFYIIQIVLFITAIILWQIFKSSKSRPEKEKPNYFEYWQKHGIRLKWWAVVLNFIGTSVLLYHLLLLRKLQGAALAQWQIDVGFTFMFFSLLPSILVFICTVLFLRFEVSENNFKKKLPYLICATISVILPVVLVGKAELFIQ